MMRPTSPKRVAAFYPVIDCVGFAVLEDTELIDWGTMQVKITNPQDVVMRIAALIERYGVDVVVTEDHEGSTRRGARMKALLSDIRTSALGKRARWRGLCRDDVKTIFAGSAQTRYEIAVLLTSRYPELGRRLPPKRKPWQTEDHRMTLFDAVAFGLTYILRLKKKVRSKAAR
jgi:hypothetical protein